MTFQPMPKSAGVNSWSVADLGSFYTEHRYELISYAARILKDSSRAEEVIQDALIKVMLAAPELTSEEHALGYMQKTVENLCIDIFRIEGRRPNLMVLDDASAEIEARMVDKQDLVDVISAAEDAAIVRQALAMLSPAERAALIMWEVEERSTAEIAAELGIKETSVRHTVSRARHSLRKVMSELIISEKNGLTALDMLSTTYKKVSRFSKTSSKAALSFVLLFFFAIAFNSMISNTGTVLNLSEGPKSSSEFTKLSSIYSENQAKPEETVTTSSSTAKDDTSGDDLVGSDLDFPGLDEFGVPSGFTIADLSGALGSAYFNEDSLVLAETELISGQIIKTDAGAANIFISQSLTTDEQGVSYRPVVSFGQSGTWVPLAVAVSSTEIKRQKSGNFLLTAYIAVESPIESPIKIVASADGRDLLEAPREVITRLVLDPSKTRVLAQAVLVVEKGIRV